MSGNPQFKVTKVDYVFQMEIITQDNLHLKYLMQALKKSRVGFKLVEGLFKVTNYTKYTLHNKLTHRGTIIAVS